MTILTRASVPTGVGIVAKNIIIPSVLNSPNNIVIVNQIPYERNTSLKWMYSVTDVLTENIGSGEISAIAKTAEIIYTIFAITGDKLNYSVEPIIINNIVALQFTNYSNNTQLVNLRRLQL